MREVNNRGFHQFNSRRSLVNGYLRWQGIIINFVEMVMWPDIRALIP